jgi:hypothetical protein
MRATYAGFSDVLGRIAARGERSPLRRGKQEHRRDDLLELDG